MICFIKISLFLLFSSLSFAQEDCLKKDSTVSCQLNSPTTNVKFLKTKVDPVLAGGPSPFSFDIWAASDSAKAKNYHFQSYMRKVIEYEPSSNDIVKETKGFPNYESWTASLTTDSAQWKLEGVDGATLVQDVCSAVPNTELCYDIVVDHQLLQTNKEVTINGKPMMLKNGTMIVTTKIGNWDWDSNSNVLKVLHEFQVPSDFGDIRSITIDNMVVKNETLEQPARLDFTLNGPLSALDVTFLASSGQTIRLVPTPTSNPVVEVELGHFDDSSQFTYFARPAVDKPLMAQPPLTSSEQREAQNVLIGCGIAALVCCLCVFLIYCKLRKGKRNHRMC